MIDRLEGLDLAPRTIYCIGRNYAEHAKELSNPVPKEPVIFTKPLGTLCRSGEAIELPAYTQRVDHEVELVVAVGKAGRDIAPARAMEHVAGYGVGIDVTARDLQEAAKAKALPWTTAKGIDTFAPLSAFVPVSWVKDPGELELLLSVNGEQRQAGAAREMLFPVPALVAALSRFFTLQPGDLVFTGTPAGVGPLKAGDRVSARLLLAGQTLAELDVGVRARV